MATDILLMANMPPLETALGPGFRLHKLPDYPDLDALLAAQGGAIRGAIAFNSPRFDRELLARLPKLEIIANLGAGYEHVDIEAARARGIVVTNAGQANAPDVAEFAIGLMLAVTRAIVAGDRHIREGLWTERRAAMTPRVSGRKLGLLGLGHIGLEVARRAVAFDMPVTYHNRRPRNDVPYRYVADPVTLAREVDYLVVALPGGPQTRHVVNRAVIEALGPRGVLINVGRGTVVDETALIEALTAGRLGGAGLDVLEFEPQVPPALLALPHVVLTPHRAGATMEAVAAMTDLVIRNLQAYFAGRPVLTPVG